MSLWETDFTPVRIISLVNRCWSLLYCMLAYLMLPGTCGKAVRVWARASLDRFGISDLCVVAALRSANGNLLTLSFSEILVRLLSGSSFGMVVPSPAAPNFGGPKTTRLSPAECALAQKREGGWGPIHFRCSLSASRRYNARPGCDTSEVKPWVENYL